MGCEKRVQGYSLEAELGDCAERCYCGRAYDSRSVPVFERTAVRRRCPQCQDSCRAAPVQVDGSIQGSVDVVFRQRSPPILRLNANEKKI
jgi:hypothetical protein